MKGEENSCNNFSVAFAGPDPGDKDLVGIHILLKIGTVTGIYPITSALLRRGLGFLPFSLGDFLYALLVIMLIRWIVLRIQQKFRNPGHWIC